jgi:hypothetical protein
MKLACRRVAFAAEKDALSNVAASAGTGDNDFTKMKEIVKNVRVRL